MKSIRYFLMALAVALGLTACDNDGDTITTGGADALTLTGSGDVVLDKDNLTSLALTLHWTDNSRLQLSDDAVQAPRNATTNTLQFSASEDFATTVEQNIEKGVTSIQFTMESLNTIVGRLGLTSDVASPVYIRIRSVLADNLDAQYSNTHVIKVTPYSIDLTRAFVLDASKNDTGCTLGSPNADGIYSGFIGATAWYNFWLQEANGLVWGNDGVTGTPFIISSAETAWNFWYPGLSGCYYTIVNTVRQEWSALYIPQLTVSGDIAGEMTYNRKENKWTLAFTAESAGQKTLRISGNGSQYDSTTGTDDAAAIATAVGFGQNGETLTFGNSATDITVNVTAAGEATLVLDLNNPLAWTCQVTEGASPEEPQAAQQLWCVGIDDGANGGSWVFEQSIPLINEDNLEYAGAVRINSLWGYRLYTQKDSWTGFYGLDSGDASSGTLVAETENNIPGATAGLYVLQASLSALTYQTTAINSVQITGINDDWSLTTMTATEETGVYTADITVTASTPWGYQILINENWGTYFGGTADKLAYGKDNIPFDDSYIGSTIHITVDLCKGTVTITQ